MKCNDNYPPGYGVNPELLLQYLIQKTDQFAHGTWTGIPLSFQVMGAALLTPLPDLWDEFMTALASEDPVSERAERCKDLLLRASPRIPECSFEESDGPEPPVDRSLANRFLYAAQKDGEEMLKHEDFRFFSVWEFMVGIGLRRDAEKLRNFQEICLQNPNPADRVDLVIPVVRETIRTVMRKNCD